MLPPPLGIGELTQLEEWNTLVELEIAFELT
jgi:hypothetical protein